MDELEAILRAEAAYEASRVPERAPTCAECSERKPMKRYVDAFSVEVCYECSKSHHSTYGLTSKTKAKELYLLKDDDFANLKSLQVPNPRKFGVISLYLNSDLLRKQQLRYPLDGDLRRALDARAAARDKRKRNKRKRCSDVLLKPASRIIESAINQLEGVSGNDDDDAGTVARRRVSLAVDSSTCEHEMGQPTNLENDVYEQKCLKCGLKSLFESL